MEYTTFRKFIGIQNRRNQMWFHARCRYILPAILNRKWHPYPSLDKRPPTWWYVGIGADVTDFKDINVAKQVCENLKRDLPNEDWAVVRYETRTVIKKKTIYKAKGENK